RKRLRLADIRIAGTNKLAINDIQPQLRSRKSSSYGFLPFLGGYARGVTSNTMLEEDRRTVKRLMQDLGFRRADVTVLQGISPNADELIITFQVEEGPLTRVADIQIQGENAVSEDRLRQEITMIKGAPFSHSQMR